jgi:ATP-dependent RNA helicase DOB1
MLLNLLRVEGANPEQMMTLSFHQFQNEQAAPALEAMVVEKEAQRDAIVVADEDVVAQYHNLNTQMAKCKQELRAIINQPKHIVQFLQPGRIVRVRVRCLCCRGSHCVVARIFTTVCRRRVLRRRTT